MRKKLKSDRPHQRRRPARARLELEVLESRCVLTSNIAPAELLPDDTLDHAYDLGNLNAAQYTTLQDAIGNSPAGDADVDWYRITLDAPAEVTMTARNLGSGAVFAPVLSVYASVPFDFFDRYAQQGVRQIGQNVGDSGVASFEHRLAAGTYYVAVSGAGNEQFNPSLAASGYPGETGDYQINIAAENLVFDASDGPVVIAANPADGATLDRSPLVLRFTLSSALNPGNLFPGDNIRLVYNPEGTFGDGNDQDIYFEQAYFSLAINELQLTPSAPLVAGFYQVFLAGNTDTSFSVLSDINGIPLGTNADNPAGQDQIISFQIVGNEGVADPFAGSDDTPATAHELGDVTEAGLVQRVGAIGDDSTDPIPFNPSDVDLYHFQISGPGNFALVAEVFARRIGSPLNSGLSLFKLDPSDGQLHLIAGNDDTQNATPASDGRSLPLLPDSAVFAGLTEGDYYLAVSSRRNVPDPTRGFLPGQDGIFDPNISQSGNSGTSYGPYALNLFVRADNSAPQVIAVSPAANSELTAPPTEIRVRFSEAVNLPQLAFRAFQTTSQSSLAPVFIEAADGNRYFPRLLGFDAATNEARFQLLSGLPNGIYTLHLSGPLGLTDLAGNALVGNDAGGDYVSTFRVVGPVRGSDAGPTAWLAHEHSGAAQAQDLGVLFPQELQAGVTIERSHRSASDTSDTFRFEVLQTQSYLFFLTQTGIGQPSLILRSADGNIVPTAPQGTGGILGQLAAGIYTLQIGGWTASQADQIAYRLRITLGGTGENPPPLTVGPAPAIRLRLTEFTPPDNNPGPPQVVIPNPGTNPGSTPPATPPLTTPVDESIRKGTGQDFSRADFFNRPNSQTPALTLFAALSDGPAGSLLPSRDTALAALLDPIIIQVANAPLQTDGVNPTENIRLASLTGGPGEAVDVSGLIRLFSNGAQNLGQIWSQAQEFLLEAILRHGLLSQQGTDENDSPEPPPMSRRGEVELERSDADRPMSASLLVACWAAALLLPAKKPARKKKRSSPARRRS